jgi:hypothetical protein
MARIAMNAQDQQQRESDIPELHVFWEAEENDSIEAYSPTDNSQAQCDWARRESFWAGRNHAERFSARLVA